MEKKKLAKGGDAHWQANHQIDREECKLTDEYLLVTQTHLNGQRKQEIRSHYSHDSQSET